MSAGITHEEMLDVACKRHGAWRGYSVDDLIEHAIPGGRWGAEWSRPQLLALRSVGCFARLRPDAVVVFPRKKEILIIEVEYSDPGWKKIGPYAWIAKCLSRLGWRVRFRIVNRWEDREVKLPKRVRLNQYLTPYPY
jgi:hypothetical protein